MASTHRVYMSHLLHPATLSVTRRCNAPTRERPRSVTLSSHQEMSCAHMHTHAHTCGHVQTQSDGDGPKHTCALICVPMCVCRLCHTCVCVSRDLTAQKREQPRVCVCVCVRARMCFHQHGLTWKRLTKCVRCVRHEASCATPMSLIDEQLASVRYLRRCSLAVSW